MIDARMLHAPGTGVSAYARALWLALAQVDRPRWLLDDHDTHRFGTRSLATARARRWLRARSARPVRLTAHGDRLSAPDIYRLADTRFRATGRLLDLVAPGGPGIVHWTYPLPVRVQGWHNLYTVHDVSPLVAPETTRTAGEALARRLAAIAPHASRIVTVSAFSRGQIAAHAGIAASRIVDAGSAVCDLTPQREPVAGMPAPGLYYLFCGMDEPRKNVARIVAAWQRSGSRRPLVLAGGAASDVPGTVTLGYLSRPALMRVMADARALIFATLEEGFGLPIVEAMAHGVPVIAADRGGAAEVAGDAALLVDPLAVDAIAGEIARIDHDDELVAVLGQRGRARAASFTTSRFADRLAALYDEIAGTSPVPD